MCRNLGSKLLASHIAAPENCCNPKPFGTAVCHARNILRQKVVAVRKTCRLHQFFLTEMPFWHTWCTRGSLHACTTYKQRNLHPQSVTSVHTTHFTYKRGVHKVYCTCSVHCQFTHRCAGHLQCKLLVR